MRGIRELTGVEVGPKSSGFFGKATRAVFCILEFRKSAYWFSTFMILVGYIMESSCRSSRA